MRVHERFIDWTSSAEVFVQKIIYHNKFVNLFISLLAIMKKQCEAPLDIQFNAHNCF